MPEPLKLTLAVGDYEITRPIIDGVVRPDGVSFNVLTKMDSTTRHWRALRNQEFDVAEVSASSYIMGRDRDLPFTAVPVFPHRRFRHGFVFINTKKGIRTPKDLIGRKVGVKSFQVTAILWMRGILNEEYGVPPTSIDWYSDLDEDIAFTPLPGLKLTRVADDQSVEKMLVEGEIDALIHPDIIDPILHKDPRVGTLFANPMAEEKRYFKKTGIFPIMHLVAIRKELVQQHRWLAVNIHNAFSEAKALAMKRMLNPRIVPLAWYREYWEEQEELLGPDPWAYGLTEQNRKTMETLIGYSCADGMISRQIPVDELFEPLDVGAKRGTFRV
jgi:4,5-dihydroxyphthalate decarboxylase